MNWGRITIAAAALLVASGCAGVPAAPQDWHRVSRDYQAAGDVGDARAYAYGGATVLELPGTHIMLRMYDAAGNALAYERMGQHYYRLPADLDTFSVRANLRRILFQYVPKPVATPAPIASAAGEQLVMAASAELDASINTLRAAEAAQLNALGSSVKHRWPLASSGSVSLFFTFDRMATQLNVPPALAAAIGAVGRHASRIHISGWTDSQVAGSRDADIAKARAESASQYLVNQGIGAEKIQTTHQAAGGFLIPGQTPMARAANRRVEIRFEFGQADAG